MPVHMECQVFIGSHCQEICSVNTKKRYSHMAFLPVCRVSLSHVAARINVDHRKKLVVDFRHQTQGDVVDEELLRFHALAHMWLAQVLSHVSTPMRYLCGTDTFADGVDFRRSGVVY